MKVCFFQCVVSNFYQGDHKLIVHVRSGTSIYCLILYDLGILQVLLGVQSLEKLEYFSILFLCLYF